MHRARRRAGAERAAHLRAPWRRTAMRAGRRRGTPCSERRIGMQTSNRHLMWHGMFLFLIGLVTGLFEQQFTNVRMGLSAHLEGLLNGIFLIALGAIWSEVRLAPWAKATAYFAALYGAYANWLVTTLAAVF